MTCFGKNELTQEPWLQPLTEIRANQQLGTIAVQTSTLARSPFLHQTNNFICSVDEGENLTIVHHCKKLFPTETQVSLVIRGVLGPENNNSYQKQPNLIILPFKSLVFSCYLLWYRLQTVDTANNKTGDIENYLYSGGNLMKSLSDHNFSIFIHPCWHNWYILFKLESRNVIAIIQRQQ